MNQICMPQTSFYLVVLVSVIIMMSTLWMAYSQSQALMTCQRPPSHHEKPRTRPDLGFVPRPQLGLMPSLHQIAFDPLTPPLQHNPYGVGLPSIATQGYGSPFQMMGFVHRRKSMMQLFGHMIYPNGTKWEYYVMDPQNQIKIPIQTQNQNELNQGDSINIAGYKGQYTVNLYNYQN
jgi:hypothetical protein